MKFVAWICTAFFLLGLSTAYAEPTPPKAFEACKNEVNAFFQAIETVKEHSGKEEKIYGLSAQEVAQIQANDGDCKAADKIRQARWEQSKMTPAQNQR